VPKVWGLDGDAEICGHHIGFSARGGTTAVRANGCSASLDSDIFSSILQDIVTGEIWETLDRDRGDAQDNAQGLQRASPQHEDRRNGCYHAR
jgi:hypothetical protein